MKMFFKRYNQKNNIAPLGAPISLYKHMRITYLSQSH